MAFNTHHPATVPINNFCLDAIEPREECGSWLSLKITEMCTQLCGCLEAVWVGGSGCTDRVGGWVDGSGCTERVDGWEWVY